MRVHKEYSKTDIFYLNPETNEKIIPYCVEPALGLDRLFLVVLCDAYKKEILPNGDEREVLKIHPYLAPIKVTILPLMKKVHGQKAMEIYSQLNKLFNCNYDESGSIGKRYRRADACGVPYVITVDDDTLNADMVTIRNRDTMEQEKINISEIIPYLNDKIKLD